MVDVAREMERRGMDLPLLIGGATTSRQHTAVRIAPAYSQPVVHVLDASRVVGVVSALLDPERRARLDAENRADQDRLRDLHAEKERKPLLPLGAARENRHRVAFDDLPVPEFTGRRLVEPDLATLREYIDWQFFFHAWELKGQVPGDPRAAGGARALRRRAAPARPDRRRAAAHARGVFGFWPAHVRRRRRRRSDEGTRFCFLRQQTDYGDSRPNRSLADYVAPDGDHLGAFAVTAGLGADELAAHFAAEHDDYHAIMVKALADRLAEAFAEYLHEIARRAWYETGPKLPTEELIAERFRGIRPAFGYPACPDHSEKSKLFALLGAEEAGLALTETYAMTPAASVSGIYFAHPEARYFSVGRVGRDQVEDYAARKGVSLAEAERWLRPNLAYEPRKVRRR